MMANNTNERFNTQASASALVKSYQSIVIPESERIVSTRFNYRVEIKDETGNCLS